MSDRKQRTYKVWKNGAVSTYKVQYGKVGKQLGTEINERPAWDSASPGEIDGGSVESGADPMNELRTEA
jgi:hypothetical protein